jgi:outer membrane usher protein
VERRSTSNGILRPTRLLRIRWFYAVAALLIAIDPSNAAHTEEVQYTKAISTQLNVTGRAINMPVPLKVGPNEAGEVMVRINPDDSVMINNASLAVAVAGVLAAAPRARLDALGSADGFVSIPALNAAGFDVSFDPRLQELSFSPLVDQKPTGEISLGGQRAARISEAAARPAFISGYLNVFAGFDHIWGTAPLSGGIGSNGTAASGRFDFESAMRVGNVVIENRALYGNALQGLTCPVVASCVYGDTAGFKRELSRLIYDMPDRSMRLEVGDVDPLGASLQRATDMLGVSLEKSERKLNPGTNINPGSQTSFRIDRPSTVEVMVNSVVLQRLNLAPGNYNVRDLPLATGANQVELSITDDTGSRRVLSSTTFFDSKLLAAGTSEWAISTGAPAYFLNEGRTYATNLFMGTGFYRYGLSDELTALAHAQADAYVAAGGLDATRQTPWGVFGLGAATSAGDLGVGAAASFNWALVNFSGLLGDHVESLMVGAEYRSPDFHTPGEFVTSQNEVLYSELNYALRLDASYSAPVGFDTTATVAARLQLADLDQFILGLNSPQDNRYGVDVTLSRLFGPTVGGSLTLGYSNESYLATPILTGNADPEFRIAVRINVRPDEATSVAAGYDSLNEQADLSAYRNEGNGLGRWDASVNIQRFGFDESGTVTAAGGYYGNRAEVRMTHSAGLDGVAFDDFYASAGNQRTSLRIGSALAFADGHLAVGAPVRGGAFAIVYPHESIADKEVVVGSKDNVRARADSLGPAVVSGLPAYLPDTIPIDVADLPLGYTLGAGAFDTFAPYRGGYDLEVGSSYSVFAYGQLLHDDGAPLALLTGITYPADNPSKQVAVFTNRAGKFAADGIASGRWVIEMPTDAGSLRYVIDVPEGTKGLYQAGVLHPLPEA